MPRKKNTLLRVLVPIIVIIAGFGIAAAVLVNTARQNNQRSSQPATTPPQSAPTQPSQPDSPTETAQLPPAPPAPDTAVPSESAIEQAQPKPETTEPVATETKTPSQLTGVLSARIVEPLPETVIGALSQLDTTSPYEFQVRFSSIGAGIAMLTLANAFDSVDAMKQGIGHKVLQVQKQQGAQALTPMALIAITINKQRVNLLGINAPVWQQETLTESSASFSATIENDAGQIIGKVIRTFTIVQGSHDLILDQSFHNLTDSSLAISWDQTGPMDPPREAQGYGGDKRRLRFGYLARPSINPSRQVVSGKDFLWNRSSGKVLGKKDKSTGLYQPSKQVWPNTKSLKAQYNLTWVGLTSRYFGVALHPIVDPDPALSVDKTLHTVDRIDRILLQGQGDPVVALRMTGQPTIVPAGQQTHEKLGLYAGPLSRSAINAEPVLAKVGLDEIIVYNFGGPCATCTFPFLTSALLGLLSFLYNNVVFDYGLAIVVLVLIVRTLLHPVTKWSQIRMQRFGKQMQGMAPKQKKIQERYADDKQRMQQEMSKLWKEEGLNPAGMLGCLPMFLQTPVWIALYASLYFDVDLRQQAAFFGIFQNISGGAWAFLGDLAEPDRFIYFGKTIVTIPILGPISSINVLPLLLGFVFFVHQKYMTPPPSATMTPEQEQQQKIMKVMMVVMFPVIMYNAPSGLALYFICNSTFGIVESKRIRAHAEKHGLFDIKPAKKKSSGGFMAKMQQLAEQKQQDAMAKSKSQQSKPAQKTKHKPRK